MKRYELIQQVLVRLGDAGSGHHGHKGVPGRRGGSAPGHGSAAQIAVKVGANLPAAHLARVSEVSFDKQQKMGGHTEGAEISIRPDANARVFAHEVGHVILNISPDSASIVQDLMRTPLFKAIAKSKLASRYHYDAETIAKETFAEYYSRHYIEGVQVPSWIMGIFTRKET